MKYLPTQTIENKATELLDSLKAMNIPVRVDAIAHRLGLLIEEAALGEDVSGLLMLENGKGVIGINKVHPLVRKRFSVAHEIGHYILHKQESDLFIDKKFTVFRDSKSSSGEQRVEIQANQFAAALLMPRTLLEKEVEIRGLDLGDDIALKELAQDFEVSVQAMAYRLSNLGIFPS